jgi:very-short-patch-repair endonuclease
MPEPAREYKFALSIGRKWRFDVAWPDSMLAVEIDGGQWKAYGGRHGRDSDREKYNSAQMAGWCVLRYSTQALENDPFGVVSEVAAMLLERMKTGGME